MKVFSIGFTQKRAETFFDLLRRHEIQRLVDIRISPDGQLSGFAKRDDFPYFLSRLVPGCRYVYMPELAPTKEILRAYRADRNWPRYVERFEALMRERRIPESLNRADFETLRSCLLCSEPTADQCHRRLVGERLIEHWPAVELIHL
ncbi:MAG TPA: DUF488 domain-containing protein [Chloroflexota bacterium]|nr:DUF488 domain-containing protein [Chloroflexota bacterium]